MEKEKLMFGQWMKAVNLLMKSMAWNRRIFLFLILSFTLSFMANNLAWGMKAEDNPHGIEAGVGQSIAARAFKNKGNNKLPIIFKIDDMLNPTTYNTQNFDRKDCQVIGGIFTYYNAIPFESDPQIYPRKINKKTNDYHNDSGWGCAWRASLNLLNNVKVWLANQGVFPDSEDKKNRQVNMYDLAEWNKLKLGAWIEPAENAEMFLCLIKDWYPTHKDQILKTLGLRGRFYQGYTNKNNYLSNPFRWKKIPLTNLREYLGLSDVTNHIDTLNKFYEDCGPSSAITTDNFPKFNDQTHPFPLNIDDGTFARNIYGFNAIGKKIKHLFIGETHVYGADSPWSLSGWKSVENIFGNNGGNIMILEIYLKDPLRENLSQLRGNLVTLKTKLEALVAKLNQLKQKLPKKILLAKTRGLINRHSDCYFNATLQCLSHLPALNDFLNDNKTKLDDSALNGLHDIFQELMKQQPDAYAGHDKFINQCQSKFKTDNFLSVVSGFFENIPQIISQDILNFAFVKEERIYEIANPKETWNTKFAFGNYPALSAVCNVKWSGSFMTIDGLSRDKFTKDKTLRYSLPDEITKTTFIQKVYIQKINIDPYKIKKEIEERIESTYNSTAIPKKKPPKKCTIADIKTDKIAIFIENLKNEEFWAKFGLSPEEAKKLIPIDSSTEIKLSRKIIPPIILILPAENDYPAEINIKKECLISKLNEDIRYELKAILVGSYAHAWAYAKEQDGQWTEYDDAKTAQFFGNQLPLTFKSLNFGAQDGYAQLAFYELDDQSRPKVEQYYKLYPKLTH